MKCSGCCGILRAEVLAIDYIIECFYLDTLESRPIKITEH